MTLPSFSMSSQGLSATNTSAGKCHLRLAFQPEPSAKDGVDRLHHAMTGVAPDVGMTQKTGPTAPSMEQAIVNIAGYRFVDLPDPRFPSPTHD